MKHESSQEAVTQSGTKQCLSAADKLLLYQDYHRSANKSKVAQKWDINRSYMYEIVKECEAMILSGFSGRRRGRKHSGEPVTLSEASDRIKKLEEEIRRIDEERERYYVRNEFTKLRLKWAEREAAELRGESEPQEYEEQSSGNSKNRNKHLKKKRRRKR